MINYLNLSETLFKFIKPIELEDIEFTTRHDWVYKRTTDVMTTEGIDWFKQRGIKFYPTSNLFKIAKNCEGPIHDDGIDFAINFIIKGYGTMEWVNDLDATRLITRFHNLDYIVYKDVKSFNVCDTWKGKLALVRVKSPHRIVTTDVDRYCLSIRSESPKTFDEAYKLLYNTDAEC